MSTTQQQRISFSTIKNRVPYPDLLEIQLKSFRDFFQLDTTAENRKNEGLYKVFNENFPITDTRNNFVLEFIDYYIDQPRYTIEECLEYFAVAIYPRFSFILLVFFSPLSLKEPYILTKICKKLLTLTNNDKKITRFKSDLSL